jgi:hypothetical protein
MSRHGQRDVADSPIGNASVQAPSTWADLFGTQLRLDYLPKTIKLLQTGSLFSLCTSLGSMTRKGTCLRSIACIGGCVYITCCMHEGVRQNPFPPNKSSKLASAIIKLSHPCCSSTSTVLWEHYSWLCATMLGVFDTDFQLNSMQTAALPFHPRRK